MVEPTLIEQLSAWQARLGLKNAEVARLLGLKNSQTLTNWRGRDTGVSKDYIKAVERLIQAESIKEARAVARSPAQASAEQRLRSDHERMVREAEAPGYSLGTSDRMISFVEIAWANGGISAGPGSVAVDGHEKRTLAFSEQWLRKKGYKRKSLVIIQVHGESMEPRLSDGDVALINTADKEIIDHRIYALRYGDDLRIKRLSRRYDGAIVISSDNPLPEYRDEVVPASDFGQLQIIGRAVWVGGELR